MLALLLAAALGGLTDEELAKALSGDVPVRSEKFTTQSGKSAGRGLGAIVIERAPAEVWTTISRYEDKAEYIPRLEKVTVREKRPDQLRCTMEVDASLTTVRYTGLYRLDAAARKIHWTLDTTAPDNNIADMEGEWLVFELAPARTLLVYWTFVDSGRMVPGFVQEYMAVKSIPDLLRGVKKRVESGGKWKKDD